MAKSMTTSKEKRQKWRHGKKNLSRITRARAARQKVSTSDKSKSLLQANLQTSMLVAGTPDYSMLQPVVQIAKLTSPIDNQSKPLPNTSKPVISRKTSSNSYRKTVGKNADVTSSKKIKLSRSKDKETSKDMDKDISKNDTDNKNPKNKSTFRFVDAVEKLENSTSIHVPKKLVLFVGNLHEKVTREQIEEHFKRAGGIKSIKIPKYRGTDTGKGFAYIEFNNTISHRLALRLHNTAMAGRKIIVEFTSNGKLTEKERIEKLKQKNEDILKMPFDT